MAGIKQPNRQSKYKTITISVIIFLALLGMLLAGNFYLSYRQSEITLKIDAVGEASDVSYNLLVGIQQLREQQLQKQELSEIATVQEAQETIDHILTLLHSGGSYTVAEETVSLKPLTSSESKTSLAKMDNIWQVYKKQLTVLSQNNADISSLNEYAIEQKEPMYNTLDEIITNLTEESRQISTYIGILQIVGICLMVIYFILFVFYFIRQMKQSDAILEEARQETRDILDSVNEGFFLLDKDMKIGQEHSKVLNTILDTPNIGGRNFADLVSGMLASDRKQDALKLFVNQLYNAHVVEKLIQGLNPLRRVEVNDGDSDRTRTLAFHFSRVMKDKKIEKVLVSVRDMTEEARLEEQLKQEQEQTNKQAEMIGQLMNADYAIMAAFLKRAHEKLYEINMVLKQPGSDLEQLQAKAQTIAREIHGIKGEASALKLSALVAQSEQLEDKVKALQAKPNLTGKDFLSAVVDLEAMITTVTQA